MQSIVGGWIYKLEAVHRRDDTSYRALTAGVEYTSVGIFDSDWDLGWIGEFLYDSRGDASDSFMQNDIFVGTRFVANNIAGTEILVGMLKDLDFTDSSLFKLEAFSRFNNQWKWRAEAWSFQGNDIGDPLASIKDDDFFQFSLEYYF